MRFELFIAARYLRARRRQARTSKTGMVGFITAISVIGVAAGVAALIIALAITNGMRRDLQERLLGATSPQRDLTPLGLLPRYQRFRVTGIFTSGFYQYDSTYAFMRLADAQRLFSEPDLISVLSFRIDDLYQAQQVGHTIEQTAGPGFQ